jgi:hypothetical protein
LVPISRDKEVFGTKRHNYTRASAHGTVCVKFQAEESMTRTVRRFAKVILFDMLLLALTAWSVSYLARARS